MNGSEVNVYDQFNAHAARVVVKDKHAKSSTQFTLIKSTDGQCAFTGTMGGRTISGSMSEQTGLKVNQGVINSGQLESNAEEAELFRQLQGYVRDIGV